jgi:hypothetical protein
MGSLTAGLIWRTNRRHQKVTAPGMIPFHTGLEFEAKACRGGSHREGLHKSALYKGQGLRPEPLPHSLAAGSYFNVVLIVENDVLSVEPMPLTAAMMASAIPAAIRAYSIAVAPD